MTDDPSGINWIKIGDATRSGKYIYETRERIVAEGVSRSRMVYEGDFLLSNSMSFGRPYIMKTSGCIHDGWLVLTPDSKRADPDYLYHLLGSREVFQQFDALAAGSTVRNLNIGLVERVKIPLPPLDEQRRIVEVLDAAFEGLTRARAHTETNLQNARELFEVAEAKLLSGGDWIERKLRDVCEKITDGTHQTPKYFESGYIFLSSKNVQNGRLNWEDIKYIDESQHLQMQARLAPRKNDILLRKNGAGYGKAAIVDRDIVFDVYVSLAVLRPKKMILPAYLLHYVNSQMVMKQFVSRIKGQGVPNLHLQEINEVRVEFPESLDDQAKIAEELDAISCELDEVCARYRSKLADLDDLRQSLLRKAFAGELT